MDMADRLYAGTTSADAAQQPAAQPEALRSDAEIADSLYRNSTSKPEPQAAEPAGDRAEIVKMREADVERRLYGRTYEAVVKDEWLGGVPAEHRDAVKNELAQVYQDISAGPHEIQRLAEVAAGIRAIDQQTLNDWDREVGERHSAEDLALARRLVNRDPAVKQFLRESMLGAHPEFVSAAVEFARRERSKGRLK